MARSIKGGKGSGYEYWSRRPNNHGCIGKKSKVIIHRIERSQSKTIIRNELYEEFINGNDGTEN